jgi:hypothetical protein
MAPTASADRLRQVQPVFPIPRASHYCQHENPIRITADSGSWRLFFKGNRAIGKLRPVSD